MDTDKMINSRSGLTDAQFWEHIIPSWRANNYTAEIQPSSSRVHPPGRSNASSLPLLPQRDLVQSDRNPQLVQPHFPDDDERPPVAGDINSGGGPVITGTLRAQNINFSPLHTLLLCLSTR